MKKRNIIVLAFAFVFAFIACGDDNNSSELDKNRGSADNPFEVYDAATLQKVGTGTDGWTLSAHYKQTDNINLSTVTNWTSIGYRDPYGDYDYNPTFRGTYDGGNYTITNLTIDTILYYQGLFGWVGEDGIVKNVKLVDCYITSTANAIGGVVGLNDGTLENCSVSGNVSGNDYVGGVVGSNIGGTVSNSYATGDVSGNDYVGGVVGLNTGTLENCYATGDVSGNDYVGGVIGENRDTLENCYATGDVSGNDYVGGVVGSHNGSMSNSYSIGDVLGNDNVGGVVGYSYSYSSTVENCYSTGDVSGTKYVGGVVGQNYSSTVSNSYSTGDVSGDYLVGGVVGDNYQYISTVENCYSTGDVSGNYYVGGVVGDNYNGTVSNCYSTGNVSGTEIVGGVVGDGTVSNCIALNGSITRTSGTETSFGRVSGRNSGVGTSTNNYARADMQFIDEGGNSSTTFPTSSSSENGTDITSAEWSSETWWTETAEWSDSVWNFSGIGEDSYPQLRNMP